MKYNLPPLEMLKRLGYTQPVEGEWLKKFRRGAQIPLPRVYWDFMEYAAGCPLFATSDLWVEKKPSFARGPRMFRDVLQETLEDRTGPLGDPPQSFIDFALDKLSWRPLERWPEDYLLIGSDYVRNMAFFGIRKEDLFQDDPPVYWWHVWDSDFLWKPECRKLSSFLQRVLVDVLSCNDYDTAKDALEEKGWRYEESFDAERAVPTTSRAVLRNQGISFLRLKKYNSLSRVKVYCCYDEKKNVFYSGIIDEGEILLAAFNRDEAGRIFPNK